MTLTKANIVEEVAEQNGYPKKQSFEMIELGAALGSPIKGQPRYINHPGQGWNLIL
jgi:hypothetical protein